MATQTRRRASSCLPSEKTMIDNAIAGLDQIEAEMKQGFNDITEFAKGFDPDDLALKPISTRMGEQARGMVEALEKKIHDELKPIGEICKEVSKDMKVRQVKMEKVLGPVFDWPELPDAVFERRCGEIMGVMETLKAEQGNQGEKWDRVDLGGQVDLGDLA